MNKPRPDSVQISSDQIDGRLARIEDRVSGIEAILAHANRDDIEALIKSGLGGNETRKKLMRLCERPRSISELVKELALNSGQSLNYHLRPLRDNGLLQHATTQPEVTYEWSPLVRRLSKSITGALFR
jgi:hypothetical protein